MIRVVVAEDHALVAALETRGLRVARAGPRPVITSAPSVGLGTDACAAARSPSRFEVRTNVSIGSRSLPDFTVIVLPV